MAKFSRNTPFSNNGEFSKCEPIFHNTYNKFLLREILTSHDQIRILKLPYSREMWKVSALIWLLLSSFFE